MVKIGTRDSQLALWQANLVRKQLLNRGVEAELVLIKSEGDIDLVTPLYALGVQGVFTKTLDAALLSGKIDLAVHSMKDVPTQLAQGIVEAAVLERASWHDIFVPKNGIYFLEDTKSEGLINTSSVRRKAQWLRRYPRHLVENIRGNVNTRLRKVAEGEGMGAIFAAAGLERIGLKPDTAVTLDWMLPAPAQGAIMVVCRQNDDYTKQICAPLHHAATGQCVGIERNFLSTLMGGCSAPISALAVAGKENIYFQGNVLSIDGREIFEIREQIAFADAAQAGKELGHKIAEQGAGKIIAAIRKQDI